MDTSTPAYRGGDAFRARDSRRIISNGILDPDPGAFVFADVRLHHGTDRSPPTTEPRDHREALEEYLLPLIGGRAEEAAAILIARFGTLARAVAASPKALSAALAHQPEVATAICAARGLVMAALSEQLTGQAVDIYDRALHDYLRGKLANPSEERLYAIFMDCNDRYLLGETLAQGSRGQLTLRARDLVHRALDVGASGLLLAHNHPSGSSQPSEDDIRSTEQIWMITRALELNLIDHLIIGSGEVYSLKKGQLL